MPTAVQATIQVLEMIVQGVPIGTNLGLLYMLWAMLSGSFLNSRGAIFPALLATSLICSDFSGYLICCGTIFLTDFRLHPSAPRTT